jgi:GT2 family glycosyltransferase
VDWVSGAVLLLPLAEVLAAGGFDEGYFMYTEEVDLQLRLRREGIPSLLDADLEVHHLGGGSSGGEARRRRWLVGARMRYARKHGNVHLLRAGMTAATWCGTPGAAPPAVTWPRSRSPARSSI